MPKKKKIVVIDAHALIFRAYHALPPLSTKRGEPVGAVYGFLLILMKALKDLKPEYVAVTFDSPGKTFRHKRYKKYKANRPEPDPEIVSQFPIVQEFVKAFGFANYAVKGYEADDLIGTICEQQEKKEDLETIIVTGDMDLLQLVDSNTKVMKLHKGVKETVVFDPVMVKAKYEITPEQITDFKGLRGDSSDNIPGVKGIGEKGATELLKTYKSVEGIFKHLDKITGRNRTALEGAEADALLSKELATIAKDAPIAFTLEDAQVGSYDQKKIKALFQKYEFKSLLAQLNSLPGFELKEGLFASKEDQEYAAAKTPAAKYSHFNYTLVQHEKEIKALAANLSKQKIFACDTETTGLNALEDDLVGMSFSWKKEEGWYVACGTTVPTPIKKILENPKIKKTGHNIKFDIKMLHHAGVEVHGVAYDTMLASYLLNSGSRGHGLDNLAFGEFGHEMQPIEDLIGKGRDQISMADVDVEKVAWYAAEDADFSWRLYEALAPQLKKEGLDKLMNEIEMPIVPVLVKMEELGVKLNPDFLHSMSKKMHSRIRILEKNIQKQAGTEFNVASNVQLKGVLFEKMKLSTDKIKRTKTGFSTSASELEKMRDVHPIIGMIQEFRELSKLTSTYVDALPTMVNKRTGRIHTSYNQTIAATGRLSSTDPNLQNIPIRTELGREIRKAFIPEQGNRILSLDYSQIELRIVAHLSKDKVMSEAFQNGEDIHTRTAAELHEVKQKEVTKEMRRQAKAINFGILYGMGVQGIQRDSGVSREEAKYFLDRYFTIHSGIKAYLEKMKEFVHERGYAETIFGRRRPLPDIKSSNRMIAAAAERAGVNMPIQGFAADLMKLAMIAVHKAIEADKIDAQMLLQVHDELVFEVKKSKVQSEAKKIREIMESVYKLDVPLIVDVEAGTNWGELKPL